MKHLSSYDFLKTVIGDLLDAIGDLSAAKRKAASRLHVPYSENWRSDGRS